ncbi:MAG: hypothetical protein E7533_06495 [Ruminococcaceae bacterium]|nr:hypothetical protein [Oscillospiraceae bacterium]
MKKFISIILVCALLLTLSACGDKKPEDTTTTEQYVLPTPTVNSDISLPFTSAADFNPYTTKSALNRDILPVLYESLFVAKDSSAATPLLASSSEIDGKKIVVKLVQGVVFSDGSIFSSKNVVESFEKAQGSPYYKNQLKNITSVKATDNYTVEFILSNEDVQVLNTLDFPIARKIKNEYIGTGKYLLSRLDDALYLAVNKKHREYNDTWNEQIALYDMSGITSPVYPFKANEISVYKNDLSEEYVNLSSKTVSVGTDNLVYVGVNSQWAGTVTSIPWVRQAINIGINRKNIAAASYLGQATATVTPFKAGFSELDKIDIIGVEGDLEKSIGILERNGYDDFNGEGVRTNGVSALRVNILVCTENKYKVTVAESFKAELEKLGFGVTITKKKTAEDFTAALAEGHYSFYIGEAQLTPNCDLSEFFSEGGNLSYGINEEMFIEYSSYKANDINTVTFVENFCANIPFLPLFYKKAIVSVNPNIEGLGAGDTLYSSVSNWKLKK